jgi:hypothetical protein
VLIDVIEADPSFGERSTRHMEEMLGAGLVVSPVTYAELAPVFEGSLALQDEFLSGAGVGFDEPWTWEDTVAAHRAWSAYVKRRRARRIARRPLADVLIGAFACRHDGLITRNPDDFASLFPGLALSDPTVKKGRSG